MARRVVLVGAGSVAQVHAEILGGMRNVALAGVVDPRGSAAVAFAEKWNIPRVFASAKEALGAGEADCVHVLTPPNAHAAAALPFLEAGIPALIEKPLAADTVECSAVLAAAAKSGVALGVNQNFVYHRSFVRLRRLLADGRLGRVRSISCSYSVPLRQISARQFDHWVFAQPVNTLLEQAVHPLSQLLSLAGQCHGLQSLPGPAVELPSGAAFYPRFSLLADCTRCNVVMQFAVGEAFPFWQIAATCDDGVAVADIACDRFYTHQRTRWLDPIDHFLSGTASAAAIGSDSLRNVLQYMLSTARIRAAKDPFFESMRESITRFHRALDQNQAPELDGAFGAQLVAKCEQAAASAASVAARQPRVTRLAAAPRRYDVLVIGATGFIGRHVVRRLLVNGHHVAALARTARFSGNPFDDERVVLLQGDASSRADLDRAIAGARIVVNLAHGAGGGAADVRAAMISVTEAVARACLAHRVERVVYVGSIAGLYLGPQDQPVTGSSPPDPQASRRSEYARAKAECDGILLDLHRTAGLPVSILRPVVGEGGVAAHGALGFFNNEQHCIGCNAGKNPLPFVLVEDVADAIVRSCEAPVAIGRCYNLVGDVRLSAREYVAELAQALHRPLRFHPKDPNFLWLQELSKCLVKRIVGRNAPAPTRRDLLSRGLVATFDCRDARDDLGRRPTSDRARFIDRGIRVHAPPASCR